MKNDNKNHLKITGTGNAAGGTYNKVKIVGEGSVRGDVNCKKMSCVGTTEIRGSLKSERVKVLGEANVTGDLQADLMRIRGSMTVHGDCEIERLDVKGGLIVDGLMNAGNIDLQMYWPCRAKEIGGDKIVVRRPGLFKHMLGYVFSMFKSVSSTILSAETIEADDIDLKYTIAKVVRGNHVVIGAGCHIDRVEYRGTFRQLNGAVVTNFMKV